MRFDAPPKQLLRNRIHSARSPAPRPTSCSAVQLPKIPRPSCTQSHNQLMLIARAPQNHKLNFKCKTTKTVAKQQDRFFESSLETHARDSGLVADHATGETSDRDSHGTSHLYRDVVAVRRGGVSIFAWSSPAKIFDRARSLTRGLLRRRYDHRD